jgi:hypothetical protein
MEHSSRSPRLALDLIAQIPGFWNWKCALLSATARSLVYLAALSRSGMHGRLAIIVVEIAYVTLTSGLYAGMQQKALGFQSKLLGDITVVLGVPMLAQLLDWLTHRAAGAPVPGKATLAVCIFAVVSALFHLHVMRRGAFLTGHRGQPLLDDFRRIPRLIVGFALIPVAILPSILSRLARAAGSQPALGKSYAE